MTHAIPLFCPLCQHRFTLITKSRERFHIFLCSNPDQQCIHLTYDLQWEFHEMSWYFQDDILVQARPNEIIINGFGTFPFHADPFKMDHANQIIKTYVVFS